MLLLPTTPAKALCLSPGFHDRNGRRLLITSASAGCVAYSEQPGELDEKPLIVLVHGIAFPGPATALEADWAAGMERNGTLSRNSRLIVLRRATT